jgi:hypothetical protein
MRNEAVKTNCKDSAECVIILHVLCATNDDTTCLMTTEPQELVSKPTTKYAVYVHKDYRKETGTRLRVFNTLPKAKEFAVEI